MRQILRSTLAFGILLSGMVFSASAQTKLLRFPDIHGQTVVFCYAGDLWKAPADGGDAIRLTAHPGQELFPKFSPNGEWIAFTAQYDGDEQVYIMPSAGGIPKQLTYYPARGPLAPRWGYDNQVYGWTPDGTSVFFRGLRDANGGSTETALYTVSIDGGLPVKLPMPTSGAGDFSPDGKRMIYSPLFRDFRTWKRYSGGWAQDLYIFDLNTYAVTPVSHTDRTERDPMWIGDKICFVSDRDGTLNIYQFDIDSEEVTQLTNRNVWDVRWASSDNTSKIVYELNGELQVYDIESGNDQKISIRVPDDGLAMRPSRYDASDNIEDFELSPKGERALFVARGDVFSVPIEKGSTRNLTNSSNAHDKWARWSPDGSKIAYISDVSGEEQIYLTAQDGSGEPEQLTTTLRGMLFALRWAPDGKRLAFGDKEGRVHVLNIETREITEIADDQHGVIMDYAWSPCGGHLAFSMSDWSGYNSIYIWSVEDNETRRITGEYFNEFNPAWGPGGDYLFYLSDRSFAPLISSWEWNFAGDRETGVYAMTLRKDVKTLFEHESDEVTVEKEGEDEESEEKEDDEAADKDDEKEEGYAMVDFDGMSSRALRVPVEADNYSGLSAVKGHLLYVKRSAPFYGRGRADDPVLQIFDIEKRKESTLVDNASSYALSMDGKKLLAREGSAYNIYDVKPEAKDKKKVSTSGLMVDRIPAEEWMTIFDEVWRRYRDFFYVDNMHGYDWKAIGDRYRQLVRYVAHRSDLNYLIGEMISELSVGHAYIAGGDYEIPDRPKVALPGARFELDDDAGRYRIAKIFEGQNEEPKYRAPLTEVGVDANVGDYVLAIDGEELKGTDNPYRLLQHKTNPVTLLLNDNPDEEGAREVVFDPITSEASLLYMEWVSGNRKKVDEATGGRVGYLHLPDMGGNGIYEFIKWYYPQMRKEGLIVDVRSNGGGNVSQWIIERLDTELLGTRFGHFSDKAQTYPYSVFHGHMACLLNETSASDGDIFPHRFREAGLGPLIGKRSWGGVVGISGWGPLLDGGIVYVPLQGTNDVEGNWVIEGTGVEPDIVVENDPQSVLAGRDPQLERGIEEVMKKIREEPKKLPGRPPDPVKTGRS